MYPLSVKQTYLAVFKSSASSADVPGLLIDPFSILLGARKSTEVTSQTNCLPSSQGTRVIPSGRFPSPRVRPYGSKFEGTLIELSARSTRVLRLWCLEKRPCFWHRKHHDIRSFRQVYHNGKCVSCKFSHTGGEITRCAVCRSVNLRPRFQLGRTISQAEPMAIR